MPGESTARRGLMTEAHRERPHAELTEAAERAAPHMSVTMYAVVAPQPGRSARPAPSGVDARRAATVGP
jgi:hypothetical protein